jgi:hypothetical protein
VSGPPAFLPGRPTRSWAVVLSATVRRFRPDVSPKTLRESLGQRGSILVYNAAFESQRLSELAPWLPEFTERIRNIQARLWDLLPVVRRNCYHPAFAGSYILKSVLRALVPGMTYEGMAVSNGQDAGLAWGLLIRRIVDESELERLTKALLDYCRQDTLAVVKLLDTFG